MPTESPTHIDDFDTARPAGGEDGNLADNYIRDIKTVLKTDFPEITGPVTATQTELNYLDGSTPGTGVASKALVLDANKDVALGTGNLSATDLTATGALVGATIDGPLGSVTPAAIVGTSLALATGATVTGVQDEDDMSSNSAVKLSTQQAIKAYSDSKIKTGIEASPSVGGKEEVFVSTQHSYTGGGMSFTEAHGLSGVPQDIKAFLVRTAAGSEAGWDQGDVVQGYWSDFTINGTTYFEYGPIAGADETSVFGVVGADGIIIPAKTTGVRSSMTTGEWAIYIVAKYYS